MNPVYYLVLGFPQATSRPFARTKNKLAAEKDIMESRKDGIECFYLTASEYRALTGRTAYSDFITKNC